MFLAVSPVVEDYIFATALVASFWANNNYYPHEYYLENEIYRNILLLSKCLEARWMKRETILRKYKSIHEMTSRGVLSSSPTLAFVKNLCRAWTLEKMRDVIYTCIILHKMIIKYEGKTIRQHYIPRNVQQQTQATMEEMVQNAYQMRSSEIYNSLMADLVQRAWSVKPIRHQAEMMKKETRKVETKTAKMSSKKVKTKTSNL
ncbi:uncharacterized protein LOC143613122 [Bidens hawaiensis]|uniref:uncharacterized protein LOC143613122 n=1 Tax=Bidens hawaiensis TaxID=980011 RepID=UPI00404A15CD